MSNQNIEISNQIFIGEGRVWKVYSCTAKGIPYPFPVVLKIPMGFAESSVINNIKNHSLVKSLELPTLDFLQGIVISGHPGLVGQNLNSGHDEIFVSPNTLITDIQRQLEEYNRHFFESQTIKPDSLAEIYRYRNKLKKLINFQQFIASISSYL